MTVPAAAPAPAPPRFVTALAAEKVSEPWSFGRARWRLTRPLHYESALASVGLVVVPVGFVSDYASVPRIPLAYWLAGDTAHEAAVLHDWLLHMGWPWRQAADVFNEAMRASGLPAWRRLVMYWAVRLAKPADKE